MDERKIVVRVPETLGVNIDAAAAKAGLKVSEWSRLVWETAIMHDWAFRSATTIRQVERTSRQLGMTVLLPRGACVHPPNAVESRGPAGLWCGMCGVRLKEL